MIDKLLNTLRVGFRSLGLHKLRSALTILGILIGVTAVVWLVAMGEGVSHQAQEQIKELGATNIIVRSVKPPNESSNTSGRGFQFQSYGLLRADYDRIVATIPTITRAVPMREVPKEARFLDRAVDIKLVGCTEAYFDINHLTMGRGRFLSDRDVADVDNVAVIGSGVRELLFPYENPVGRSILVDGTFYSVVGATEERAASAAIGGSLEAREYNLDVYIPLATLRARIGDQVNTSRSGGLEGEVVELSQMTLTVGDVSQVDETAGSITTVLQKFHENEDYAVVIPKELLRQAEVMQMMFNVLLVLIAGISLLVGGIGIMNIMLATVTERTKEIGIRRALGAKQWDITLQFLSETTVLSSIGGILGVVLGVCCPWIIDGVRDTVIFFWPHALDGVPDNIQNLQPRVAQWSVWTAFAISVLVGLTFGLIPARRAAAMDPIEALRHE